MKRVTIWLVLIIGLALLWPAQAGLAQAPGTEVVITQVEGPTPDVGPNVTAYVSVVANDKSAITGLPADRFIVSEDGQEMDPAVVQIIKDPIGLAVVFVLDVSKSMDFTGVVESTRLQDAKNLIFYFASAGQVRLDEADLSGLVVIYDDPGGAPQIVSPLSSDHIGNLYNSLANFERNPRANTLTPLKEGVEQAIRLFNNPTNPDAAARLPRMRQTIIILSDGLDLVSKKAETEDLINQALAAGINLYTIGIDSEPSIHFDDEALQRLANQTQGEFRHHNSQQAHDDTLQLFGRFLTQGNLYRITYPTHAARGSDHRVLIKVDADQTGVPVSAEANFASPLVQPEIEILSVTPLSVTWQVGITGTLPVTITAQVSHPDGISRPPRDIQLAVDSVAKQQMTPVAGSNDTFVGTFDAYGLSDGLHALNVVLEDSVLGSQVASSPVNLEVTVRQAPTPTPLPPVKAVVKEAKTNWWIIFCLGGLALLMLAFFILLLFRTRNVRQVVQNTTGRLKKATMRLSPLTTPAKARLVVMSGYAKGREYRIPNTSRIVLVGRDPDFCDFPLGDSYVSNPHFKITFETTDAYITDEGSTNGTTVNGVPLQPGQRMLLQRDAIIDAGGARVQFLRIGGTTRVLTGGP